jgi:hypothetical protein
VAVRTRDPSSALPARIEETLNEEPEKPWCVHRLYETLVARTAPGDREEGLRETRQAADQLSQEGRVRREAVSAVSIGVHCEDSLYWSVRSPKRRLEEFGPEYEAPTILHRLASHMQCHGL